MPVEVASTSEAGRLSAPGLRGLAVACRAAFEMVTAACEGAMDASLWIRVPGAMHSIDATMQAYELMREVREKHPHNARRAQEAAVALRDVFVLLMIDTYHCFDIASPEVAK